MQEAICQTLLKFPNKPIQKNAAALITSPPTACGKKSPDVVDRLQGVVEKILKAEMRETRTIVP